MRMMLEYLEKYDSLRKEAEDLKGRIEVLEDPRSPSLSLNPTHSSSSSSLDEVVIKKHELEKRYRKKEKRLVNQLLAIEAYLDTVHDPEIRTAIRLKYIDGHTWREVGGILCCDPSGICKKVIDYVNTAE